MPIASRVISMSDCKVGAHPFEHSTSTETYMLRRHLAAMLATYTGIGVTPEVNLREHISRMPPPTLVLKLGGDIA